MANRIISIVTIVFFTLGALDYLLKGRFGLGKEFERGFQAAGDLMLYMAGCIVLAPAAAQIFAPVVSPFFRAFGIDPSVFAGLIFANDSGGAVLALKMADQAEFGLFHGLIVGAVMGTSVMFIIPISIANTDAKQHPAVISGLLCGIITAPVCCLAGGLAQGLSLAGLLLNTAPVLVISGLLALALIFCHFAIIRVLTLFGKGVLAVSIIGLSLAAIQRLSGITLIPGMGSLDEVFSIVGGICIFLSGAFPLLSVLQRVLSHPLQTVGERLNINQTAVSGLLLALANGIPVMVMLKDMDERGCMINTAFLVSVSCVFGDHLAYTLQTVPDMCGPVIIGKLAGGISALLLALLLSGKLLSVKGEKDRTN